MDDRTEVDAPPDDELERLRAENDRLKAQLAGSSEPGSWRRWVSILCAVLVAILVPLATLTVWAGRTVLETDQYVETVEPLVRNDAVRARATELLTEAINEEVDFNEVAEEFLPEELSVLAGPIAGGAQQIVGRVVAEVVASDAFATVWSEANRVGHSSVVAVLKGENVAGVDTRGGRIVVGLTPAVQNVVDGLEGLLGPDFIERLGLDDLDVEFVLLESEDLGRAQDLFDLLDQLSWFVPLVALLVFVAGVVVARHMRLGFRRMGVALVVSGVVTLVLIAALRGRVVGEAVDVAAAGAVFDTLVRFLVRSLRVIVVLGAAILVAAWAAGPSKSAGRVREGWDSLLGRASADSEPSPLTQWIATHRSALQIAVVALGVVALLMWTRPTGWVVLWISLAVVAGLAVVGFLARVGEGSGAAVDAPAVATSTGPEETSELQPQ